MVEHRLTTTYPHGIIRNENLSHLWCSVLSQEKGSQASFLAMKPWLIIPVMLSYASVEDNGQVYLSSVSSSHLACQEHFGLFMHNTLILLEKRKNFFQIHWVATRMLMVLKRKNVLYCSGNGVSNCKAVIRQQTVMLLNTLGKFSVQLQVKMRESLERIDFYFFLCIFLYFQIFINIYPNLIFQNI